MGTYRHVGGNSGDTGTALTGKQHFASLLYENALGRTASQSELDYWAQELTNGRTGAEVAYGFLFSEEFQRCGLCRTSVLEPDGTCVG